MKKIESFLKDHDKLEVGIYSSVSKHGITTFDLRFKKPNTAFFTAATAHTIEHILATELRNSTNGENIVYFGPMGCMTGFYLLTVNLSFDEVVKLLVECIKSALVYTAVPGSKKSECGNYLSHDLKSAKIELENFLRAING